jgi:alpha-galactosidase
MVPLWRSDYAYEPIGHQCETYGLSPWIPYSGTATVADVAAPYYGGGYTPVQPYAFWSNIAPSLGLAIDARVDEIDYAELRRLTNAWREVIPYYYGDFYPLIPYSLDHGQWAAWQFDDPEKGEGLVQVFRRDESVYREADLRLRALDPSATYEVRNVETGETTQWAGSDLAGAGLRVVLGEPQTAGVFTYKTVR